MKTLNVLNKYDILIDRGILDRCGELIKHVCRGKRCCIISDDNVAPLYAERVLDSMKSAGYEVSLCVFPHGEKNKHIGIVTEILTTLADNSLTRSDFVVALGGGVTGDLAGFAASIYLRGIAFVQIPTTLLAQIDSSVGGKTGCDLPAGKNLVGAFHHPSAVIIDPDILDTLPDKFMRDGMGELIKYGAIRSVEIFEMLENNPPFASIDELIYKCVEIKAGIVERDFTEAGERTLLNFGHTVGHAIEKLENFNGMSHGCAVAAGMCIITRAAEKVELCFDGNAARIEALCKKYDLPTGYAASADDIATAAMADKKRNGDMLKLVLIRKIGDSFVCPIRCSKLSELLEGCVEG